ncbi:MAG: hypothetical protein DME87_13170 [Verrucomicrobia bacterium]|nr:MAG: hypothetical protein DME87_13170 [Verrucomicrobiota bacterium]PYL74237.1 MAG: hypothetical protein DMF26_11685 [Verrucomicrobiota bacterium]
MEVRFAIFRFLFGHRSVGTPVLAKLAWPIATGGGLTVKNTRTSASLFLRAERPLRLITAII